jgi:nucleotide-binding universal stress UspA family protein
MALKIMVALDASEGAWRAIEYVARSFGQTPGVEVTLLHILTGLPPAFWDDGHILEEKEREARERLIAQWQADQEKNWQGLVAKAKDTLVAAGIPAAAVAGKFKPKYYDVAEDIINEAVGAGCSTVIMGRRGLGKAKALLMGSVTSKVVHNAKGCAVTIVE